MAKRQVPDREGLELGVTGLYAPVVLVVDLRQAGAHLAAVGSGGVHHNQRRVGLDVGIGAVALVAHHPGNVGRIARDGTVSVNRDPSSFQLVAEGLGGGLPFEAGDHNGPHVETVLAQVVDQLEGVGVVGDPEIRPYLAAVDISGIDAENDLGLVGELLQEAHLHIGVEPRQDTRGVVVVQQLAAELQVQLPAHLAHSLADGLALFGQIALVVEGDGARGSSCHESPRKKRFLANERENNRAVSIHEDERLAQSGMIRLWPFQHPIF